MKASKTILREGLRKGDLADLVLPLISVDEYVSKVDPSECIVLGFYVHDEDAAKDLNRFLQKSAVSIMDTEVSPAPDQHGYFMVFVELIDNDRMPENVVSILAEIKPLVAIEEWQMRVRKTDGLVPFSEDNLKDCLKNGKKNDNTEDILEFLRPSTLTKALVEEGGILVLEGSNDRHVYKIKAFGHINTVLSNQGLTEAPITFNIRTIAKMNRIRRSLGENWEVVAVGKFIMLHNSTDPRGILLSS